MPLIAIPAACCSTCTHKHRVACHVCVATFAVCSDLETLNMQSSERHLMFLLRSWA